MESTNVQKYRTLLARLNLEPTSKLTLKKARTVDKHTLKDNQLTSPHQIPDYILKTLMIVNPNAREFKLKSDNNKNEDNESDESEDEDNAIGINPMDALLAIFYCSDDYLRQYLALKLSACQFSVPFLLPDPAAPSENVTMLLSASENITKTWKVADNNTSAQQVFATEHAFPVVTFIRVGKNTLSKSSLMNNIMSNDNEYHNFFFHKNVKGGDVERKIVDGLVELSWYLPGGSEGQAFKNEMCVANLRGDAREFKKQMNVLFKISSILCILLPSEYPADKTTKEILERTTSFNGKVIIIFDMRNPENAKKYFNELKREQDKKISLITKAARANDYEFYESIRKIIQKNIRAVEAMPLVKLASSASELGLCLDRVRDQSRWDLGQDIADWLELGAQKAKELLKLQTHVPTLAELEREKYCPKRKVSKSKSDEDFDEIENEIKGEKLAQMNTFAKMDKRFISILNRIVAMSESERNYTWIRLKHELDKMSMQVMTELQEEYRVTSTSVKNLPGQGSGQKKSDALLRGEKKIKQVEESIAKCSFGLEHVIRELAQLFQLPDVSTYDYAGVAAEMLLLGHPLELLDGDSSYIPLRWFEAVYRSLECKTNNAKIFVISVLGIQSSGKSTMLNTMFGLEFPVSAGRCTRGVFASLVPVSDALKSESNFDYVLIIDTEGLRGSGDPHLREHDNSLATFAIGVADVTIVNIFGENLDEMKEFLEIAVHAFLKMKLVNEKKSCKIVHQNVQALDVENKLAVNRGSLKQHLDEMTKLAASHENCEDTFQKFNDIITFDESKDVFYIPSLLQGSPPMAPVNPKYGRAVERVNESIIAMMCPKKKFHLSISQFRERVCNLWKAMLKENFIFCFRNVIEVRAHTNLDRKYFQEFVNVMVTGMAELERRIQVALSRCTQRDERAKVWAEKKMEILKEANELGEKMETAMKEFFETSEDKATLEQWKENVMNKIRQYKENQVMEITKNCYAMYIYLETRQEIDEKKEAYEKELLQKARKFITLAHDTNDVGKCMVAFNKEWEQWIKDVPTCKEHKNNVNDEMVHVLRNTDSQLKAEMTEKLRRQKFSILSRKGVTPRINIRRLHIPTKVIEYVFKQQHQQQCLSAAITTRDKAVDAALEFAKKASKSGVRCRSSDLTRMYEIVVTILNEETKKNHFTFDKSLICDILIYAFANAYDIFKKMEEKYCQARDMRGELERDLRPRLEKYFVDLCSEMEKEVLVANAIIEVLKKPIESELNQTMGPAVTRTLDESSMYKSKAQFQATVLIQLGQESQMRTFDTFSISYIPYLKNPIRFMRTKLMRSIENYCLHEKKDLVNLLLANKAKEIEDKVLSAISTASTHKYYENPTVVATWIQRFVEACSTLEITKEMFAVAATEDILKDIEMFEGKLRKKVPNFLESLVKRGVDHEVMQKWDPSPQDHLLTSIFGCQECCPFCGALCDQTIQNHPGQHSTRAHRPQGLSRYRYENTGDLVVNICTYDIDGDGEFKNVDTSWEWHPNKDYQTVNERYASWSIPADRGIETSIYWKWFIANFSKELAQRYEAKEPKIPEAWKSISFDQVREELQNEYQL